MARIEMEPGDRLIKSPKWAEPDPVGRAQQAARGAEQNEEWAREAADAGDEEERQERIMAIMAHAEQAGIITHEMLRRATTTPDNDRDAWHDATEATSAAERAYRALYRATANE